MANNPNTFLQSKWKAQELAINYYSLKFNFDIILHLYFGLLSVFHCECSIRVVLTALLE